ncbi:MAG: hypothetical protein ACE5K0_04605 [Candidatus Methanofastidiosia archaeon]
MYLIYFRRVQDSSELVSLLSHVRETASKVDGVEFKDIHFSKGKDEFILVMDCADEDKYLEWRTSVRLLQRLKNHGFMMKIKKIYIGTK